MWGEGCLKWCSVSKSESESESFSMDGLFCFVLWNGGVVVKLLAPAPFGAELMQSFPRMHY